MRKGRKKPSVYLAYKNSKVAETPESACLSSSSIFFSSCLLGRQKKTMLRLTFFFFFLSINGSVTAHSIRQLYGVLNAGLPIIVTFLIFFLIKHFNKVFYFLRTNVI